jgi:hypothetical protein
MTIDPARRSIIPGRNVFKVRNVAVRLPSTAECHSSSLSSCTGPGRAVSPPGERGNDIYSAKLEYDGVTDLVGRLEAGCIGRDTSARAPAAWIEATASSTASGAASDDADARAVAGQPGGHLKADPVGASRDHGDLAVQLGITASVLHLSFKSGWTSGPRTNTLPAADLAYCRVSHGRERVPALAQEDCPGRSGAL